MKIACRRFFSPGIASDGVNDRIIDSRLYNHPTGAAMLSKRESAIVEQCCIDESKT